MRICMVSKNHKRHWIDSVSEWCDGRIESLTDESIKATIEKAFRDRVSVIKSRYDLSTGRDIHKRASECASRVMDLELLKMQILRELNLED